MYIYAVKEISVENFSVFFYHSLYLTLNSKFKIWTSSTSFGIVRMSRSVIVHHIWQRFEQEKDQNIMCQLNENDNVAHWNRRLQGHFYWDTFNVKPNSRSRGYFTPG